MQPGTLEGNELYLRPLVHEDVGAYHRSLMHDEVRRLTGTKTIFSRASIEKYIEDLPSDSSRLHLLIILKETNRMVGDIALQDIDLLNRNSNLRIAIFQEQDCGKGFGSESLKLMLNYGFGIMNLHRIELNVYAFNTRAIQAYEKLGFVREGIQREVLYYNYEYHDSITMSLLQHEYRPLSEAK